MTLWVGMALDCQCLIYTWACCIGGSSAWFHDTGQVCALMNKDGPCVDNVRDARETWVGGRQVPECDASHKVNSEFVQR
jgi:hypothetical protein